MDDGIWRLEWALEHLSYSRGVLEMTCRCGASWTLDGGEATGTRATRILAVHSRTCPVWPPEKKTTTK